MSETASVGHDVLAQKRARDAVGQEHGQNPCWERFVRKMAQKPPWSVSDGVLYVGLKDEGIIVEINLP